VHVVADLCVYSFISFCVSYAWYLEELSCTTNVKVVDFSFLDQSTAYIDIYIYIVYLFLFIYPCTLTLGPGGGSGGAILLAAGGNILQSGALTANGGNAGTVTRTAAADAGGGTCYVYIYTHIYTRMYIYIYIYIYTYICLYMNLSIC
jgi:hypothetical protein